MTREKIFDKLNRVFQDVFDNETLELEDNTTADDIEEWDSLTHIDLVVAVEREFGIKFSMGEVRKMQNVGEMVDIILKRI